jgi:hypothetical protein
MNFKATCSMILALIATSGVAAASESHATPDHGAAPSHKAKGAHHRGKSWTRNVHGRVVAVDDGTITLEQRIGGREKQRVYRLAPALERKQKTFSPGEVVSGKARMHASTRQGHRHVHREMLALHASKA